MIQLLQAPTQNVVIPDANTTVIRLRAGDLATDAANPIPTYLEATILVDNQSFLQQHWSQDDNGFAEFNLKGMLRAYFPEGFVVDTGTGFNELPGLVKKVNITVKEYHLITNALIDTRVLPTFYMIKSTHPTLLDGNGLNVFEVIDFPHTELNVPKNGIVRFPILVKKNTQVTTRLKNAAGATISGSEITSSVDADHPKVIEVVYNLNPLNLSYLTPHITLEIQVGGIVQTITLLINWNARYTPQLLYFENNFGGYCAAYLFGKLENSRKLKPASYKQEDGTDKVFFIEDDEEFRVNSGYFYEAINKLLLQIAKSLDVVLYTELNYLHFKVNTKSVLISEGLVYVYDQRLVFERKATPRVTNLAYEAAPPVGPVTPAAGSGNTPFITSKEVFLTAYTDETYEAASIVFISTPENGSLYYKNAAEDLVPLFEFGVDDEIDTSIIDWDDFVELQYHPNVNAWGDPIDVISFKMGNEFYFSEASTIKFTIPEFTPANQPPTITTASTVVLSINASGDGEVPLDVSIVDPEDDPVSILWEVVDEAPLSFNNNTLESPLVSIAGASENYEVFQIKVTATDTANDLSSEKIIDVIVARFIIGQEAILNEGESTSTMKVFDYRVFGGQLSTDIDVEARVFRSFDKQQWAGINHDTEDSFVVTIGIEKAEDTFTFGETGEIEFKIALHDPAESGEFVIEMLLKNATGTSVINTPLLQIEF